MPATLTATSTTKSSEDEVIETVLALISKAADEANHSLMKTIERLDRLHMELAKRALKPAASVHDPQMC